ncbi:hypothetical protein BC6307_19345 [Sutcliffiella cohnii]|uniref:Uncharacterized protein n=1 Tax=Sutcliffiella cohnii TaxID=33932 RepID=A0A223KV94_9BACI|nr:hypothetical protein [Sutcliffiella cohnii]AST93258.1 hypothetical protein BC6307_19345 [Sutcliffiella cohnii]
MSVVVRSVNKSSYRGYDNRPRVKIAVFDKHGDYIAWLKRGDYELVHEVDELEEGRLLVKYSA